MDAFTPMQARSSLKSAPGSVLATASAGRGLSRGDSALFMDDQNLTLDGFALPPELPPGAVAAAGSTMKPPPASASRLAAAAAPLPGSQQQQQQWYTPAAGGYMSQPPTQDLSLPLAMMSSQHQQQPYAYAPIGTPSASLLLQPSAAASALYQLPAPQLSAQEMQYLAARQQQQQAMMAAQEMQQQRHNVNPITFPVREGNPWIVIIREAHIEETLSDLNLVHLLTLMRSYLSGIPAARGGPLPRRHEAAHVHYPGEERRQFRFGLDLELDPLIMS